jgi:hypothetical protein
MWAKALLEITAPVPARDLPGAADLLVRRHPSPDAIWVEPPFDPTLET